LRCWSPCQGHQKNFSLLLPYLRCANKPRPNGSEFIVHFSGDLRNLSIPSAFVSKLKNCLAWRSLKNSQVPKDRCIFRTISRERVTPPSWNLHGSEVWRGVSIEDDHHRKLGRFCNAISLENGIEDFLIIFAIELNHPYPLDRSHSDLQIFQGGAMARLTSQHDRSEPRGPMSISCI